MEGLNLLMDNQRNDLENLLAEHRDGNDFLSNLDIRFGVNEHDQWVRKMQQFGKKVLFLTGSRAMRSTGFLETYKKAFQAHGFDVKHFDNITSNPTLDQMKIGLGIAKEFEPEFIFALGGGSVIDTAKIISVGAFGEPWDYVEKKCEITQAIPVVAATTTSGTGSHATSYAVVTNTDSLEKKTLKHPLLLPKLSIVDVSLLQGMPSHVIASTGYDVICHATEVYTRADVTESVKDFCFAALPLIKKHLKPSYRNHPLSTPKDRLYHRAGMAYADTFAGIALALLGTHLAHAVSHPISAHFEDISHGRALAYITPETARMQIQKGGTELKEKYRELSRALGGGNDFGQTMREYRHWLDLELKDQRFTTDACEKIFQETFYGYRKGSTQRCPAGLGENPDAVRSIVFNSLLKGY